MAAEPSARARAARNVNAVLAGRSLDRLRAASSATGDAALVAELTFGTLRHWYSLSEVITHYLSKPLRQKDSIVFSLLAVGAYQLRHMRVPAHAAVNETVAAAGAIGRPWAKGLVNQILRRLSESEWPPPQSEPARSDHPEWLQRRIERQWPAQAGQVLAANLTRAPMALRVNARRGTRDDYAAELAAAGLASHAGTAASALYLAEPRPVAVLPGYDSGRVSVQDEGAQWAAHVLEPAPGERVLDACAAPGGKAMHCLEQADIELIALEIDPARAEHIEREAARLRLRGLHVLTADATTRAWWDGQPFDKVLLDAPCTGTGTLRRHPDIKLLKHERDLEPYQAIQSTLARTLAGVLKPGGVLIYCTCSMLDEENDSVIAALLRSTPELQVTDTGLVVGVPTRYGRQLLPTTAGPDGFYYARLVRR